MVVGLLTPKFRFTNNRYMSLKSTEIELAKIFLEESSVMQVATLDSMLPWICSVWYAADEDFNLYFISKDWREHSRHIEINSNVACAITKGFTEGPGQKVQGVQIRGKAHRAKLRELPHAYKTYSSKWPQLLKVGTLEAFKGKTAGTEMFVVVPEKVILFDEVNFPEEPRRQIV